MMNLGNPEEAFSLSMIPNEGEKVLAEMARNDLKRGVNGLEVYVMCEIPSNVISIDEFSSLFDGFSTAPMT